MKTVKIKPWNLNEILRSWIRLQEWVPTGNHVYEQKQEVGKAKGSQTWLGCKDVFGYYPKGAWNMQTNYLMYVMYNMQLQSQQPQASFC
jgi:hypothetical protein